jgi:hypothetical protein
MGRLEAKTLGALRGDVGAEEAVERGLVAGGQWTYRAKGKTVNVKLTLEVIPMFRGASQQYRKLKSLLNRLSHIPPSDPTRRRITSLELAHSACVSRRPQVAKPY